MGSALYCLIMKQIDANTYEVDTPLWPDFLINRADESHKGTYGHALLIAGSYGKMGAAILAAKACLRSGVGLLTVHVPAKGVDIMQTAVPEAMVSIDEDETHWTHAFTTQELEKYHAIAVGPGLGTDSISPMRTLMTTAHGKALVIDADGLNMLAQMDDRLELLRNHAQSAPVTLTPHVKEFERMFGHYDNNEARITAQRNISKETGAIIVHKGHRTQTTAPSGAMYLNTTGNAGMATAGSGDVLTGIALAIHAQNNKNQLDAAICTILAIWMHGKSGDIAIKKQQKYSLIASDIIKNLQYIIS